MNILDFRDHFPKKSFFWNFRGQKPKILKNRDSHLVEILILRLLVVSICVFIKTASSTDPRSLANFRPKWRVVTSQNRPYLKKFLTDFKKNPRMMSNCCMRRPAKFHVDSAVRFWAIANIREGGASNAPPPVKRGLIIVPIFALLGQNFSKSEDPHIARALHVHSAP